MSDPYLGEIRIFAGSFAPLDWLFCDGSLISIANNDALYSLLGTTYGGDGANTFGLPDLRGRVPIHQGGGYIPGQMAGVETVTLQVAELPHHSHSLVAATAGQVKVPTTATMPASATSSQPNANVYAPATTSTTLVSSSVSNDGQSLFHNNVQPYLAVNYIIATAGTYPPRQ
ncbi:MAG: phage tail protein [Tardiphaga sp.]|jgi:microcystin-dependent protein|nr:phage tail protein [Tardiphaga sp.]